MWPKAWPLLLALAVVGAAEAKTYCCNDDQGRRICGDAVPPQCQNRTYREVGAQGETRHVEVPITREERLRREAEAVRQKELELQMAEERRRNQALLNSYSSEKDFDFKRDKILTELGKSIQQTRHLYDEALLRKKKLADEAEFYLKKPMPEQLKSQIKENELELAAQQAALDAKEQEMDSVRVRFEAEKKRYLELTRGRAPANPGAVPR